MARLYMFIVAGIKEIGGHLGKILKILSPMFPDRFAFLEKLF